MGDVHQFPIMEAPLLERPIETKAGPVPVEVLTATMRRLRKAGVRLSTAVLLNEKTRAEYSALFGLLAGLEAANRELKRVCREQAERIKELEARL
jgi:hypothetical protein